MLFSVLICFASFVLLIGLLRRSRLSLGLPIAYLFNLLFNHVPGALAHMMSSSELTPTDYTETGIRYTAIGSVAFLVGVWVVHLSRGRQFFGWEVARRQEVATFCLFGGLVATYALGVFRSVSSIGAVVEQSGFIWVFGVLLGLREALQRGVSIKILLWLAAMFVYPTITLMAGGFLSFGSTPVFIILGGLIISTRKTLRVVVGISVISILFLHLFLSYFANRADIREAVWGGARIETRLESVARIFADLKFIDFDDHAQMQALDSRLNQNYFVGLAAERINQGIVAYTKGRSFSDGLIALVPRLIWPDKPVYAGSPGIIMEMTGFHVNDSTSYGVGNVMEFYINFGIPSLIGGFLFLGLLFGWLDRQAAVAEQTGNLGLAMACFLPVVAMNNPIGSIVELTAAGFSSYLAALGWRSLWNSWAARAVSRSHATNRNCKFNG